jgi:regulator of RNase E activity RraB
VFTSPVALAQVSSDKSVIEQLREAGSDLSKPHPIEFFLYLPNEDAARRVAEKVAALGFAVGVEVTATGDQWLVQARKTMVPDEAELVRLHQVFDDLVAPENGEYDGWGASVTR